MPIRFLIPAMLVMLPLSTTLAADSPWHDAAAVWHFGDTGAKAQPVGAARAGVALTGQDAVASRSRGGDARVAQLTPGGFLAADGADKIVIQGQTITLAARVAFEGEPNNVSILARHTGAGLAWNLFFTRENDKPVIAAEVATTINRSPLRTSVPLADLRPGKWHDVVARVNGAKLELFIDGRCVDEDFMLGDLVPANGPIVLGVDARTADNASTIAIDHVALWPRGLGDAEILALSGGPDHADPRLRTDRGIAGEPMQYWQPPNRYNVGDCFPFYHDGTFHFLYLLDKNHHAAKNGLGAHQWAQVTTKDLKTWTHQPITLGIDAQWEGSICTGSFFFHEGTYYAFYATRSSGTPDAPDALPMWHQAMAVATSKDGIHFTKQQPNPLFNIPDKFGPADFRDPVVWHDKTDGLFHMMITSCVRGKANEGVLVHMTSKDLMKWDEAEPFITGPGGGQPECPSHFEWHGKYYLTWCWGPAHYVMSDKPSGPWVSHKANVICYGDAYVPKIAPYHDNRRLICAWLPVWGWGGQALWRELVLLEDGRLGSKWPAELIPATADPLKLDKLTLDSSKEQPLAGLPQDYRLTVTIDDANAAGVWGMRLRDDGKQSIELKVDPEKKVLVLGHHTMPWDEPVTKLDVIVKGPAVDVCINDRQTIVTGRATHIRGDRVVLFRDDKPLNVNYLEIRPLR